jgi:excisionase family DNA binding protein
VTWMVDINRGMWRRCECGENYTDRAAHLKSHVERPTEDHMTVSEVAKALGKTTNCIRHWIKTGRIRSEITVRGARRAWITRKALLAFVKAAIEDNFSTATEWAKSGKFNG